ncbi:MAG: biopolymer transporter ExbD [Rubripirellula sp.]|nr:biopolymer transporter ExbD [Rubripirellula sp.]
MELKMTPMIDVVFLLLVFFVWTSSFEIPEFDLPSSIAQPPAGGTEISTDTPPPEAFDEIVVRLDRREAQLVIEVGSQSFPDIDALGIYLTEVLSLGVQPPVIVDPADQISMAVAVQVYDAARDAGADRVLFAAEPE